MSELFAWLDELAELDDPLVYVGALIGVICFLAILSIPLWIVIFWVLEQI